MPAVSGFVNRDYFCTSPDLHSRKLLGRLRVDVGKEEEGVQRHQKRALQEAIITMSRERINSHLQCINGC